MQTCFCAVLLALLALPAPSGAQGWRRLGPPGGNVISLAAAADGALYLGTADGHVFSSSDRGENWQLRGRAGNRLDGVVQSLVADPSRSGRLLAAIWFLDPSAGGGVFETLDGGRHWSASGLGGEAVRALEHSASNPQLWVAGTRSGVFLSSDDAHSWTRIAGAEDPELRNIDSLAIDPFNPQILYVGTYHLPWKTVDGGRTWTPIASGMIDDSDIMSLRIDSKNPRRIFSSACSGIYRSDDAAATWIKLQGIPYSSRRTQQIAQDPADSNLLYAATTTGLWRTSDAGENWRRVTQPGTIANAVLVLPAGKSGRVVLGTEGKGILLSDDRAESSRESNLGFAHHVIASAAVDANDPQHLLLQAESASSLLETRDSGTTWQPLSSPAKSVRSLFGTPSGWWAAYSAGGLAKFHSEQNAWSTEKFVENLPIRSARSKSMRRPMPGARIVAPSVTGVVEFDDTVLVACLDGLWKRRRDATSFLRFPAPKIPIPVTYLAAGLSGSLLAIASNSVWTGGAGLFAWREIPPPANSGRLLWIEQLTINGVSALFLGTQNGVFRASDRGAWSLIGNGLPAIASRPLARSGSAWLLAMSNGSIFESQDGVRWQRIDEDGVTGQATAVFPAGAPAFVVASRSEGLLAWLGPQEPK